MLLHYIPPTVQPSVPSPGQTPSLLGGMLERAVWFAGWMSVMLNVAFIAGSSKHGKDFRASAACICVVATTLSKPTGLE